MEKIPHTPYVSVLIHLKFVVSVSVTVSAESIGQLEFRFRYRTETKIVVSVVHYLEQFKSSNADIFFIYESGYPMNLALLSGLKR